MQTFGLLARCCSYLPADDFRILVSSQQRPVSRQSAAVGGSIAQDARLSQQGFSAQGSREVQRRRTDPLWLDCTHIIALYPTTEGSRDCMLDGPTSA